MELKYGRTPEEWDDLVQAAVTSLKRTAGLGRMTNYTDLNRDISARTGHRAFDFSQPDERSAMGHLLGEVVDRTYPECRAMLSGIVEYLDENKPGAGFYNLAVFKGLLDKDASKDERDAFWYKQVDTVHEAYKRKGSRFGRRR
ncbi:MAG TPA: hypothetical protein GXZ46_04550 [Actinomycetales bacterium]|nr:hypothetical protein [Actinomycetales bacterium]